MTIARLYLAAVVCLCLIATGCKTDPKPPVIPPQPRVEFAPPTTVPSVTPLAQATMDLSVNLEKRTLSHADRIALKTEYADLLDEARAIAAENRALTTASILAFNKAVENDARAADLTVQVIDARAKVKGWEDKWEGHLVEDWKVEEQWKLALSESVQRERSKDKAVVRWVGGGLCLLAALPLIFGIFLISTSAQKAMGVTSLGGGGLLLSLGIAILLKPEPFADWGIWIALGCGVVAIVPGIWGLVLETKYAKRAEEKALEEKQAAQADATEKTQIAQSITGGVEIMKATGIIARENWKAAKDTIEAQAAVVMPDADITPLKDFVASNTP